MNYFYDLPLELKLFILDLKPRTRSGRNFKQVSRVNKEV